MGTTALGTIGEDGVDSQWLEELVPGLRRDLLAGDVAAMRQVHESEAPAGYRAIKVAAVGTFLVALEGSAQAIGEMVAAMCSWLDCEQVSRTVHLTVTGSTVALSGAR